MKEIVEMLTSARSRGVRYPKITTRTLRFALTGNKSKYGPGNVHITSADRYGEAIWYGRLDPRGTFYAARDIPLSVRSNLSEIQLTGPRTYMSALGREAGACAFCQRELTTVESLTAGYGPDCAQYYGLPWGDRSTFLTSTGTNLR